MFTYEDVGHPFLNPARDSSTRREEAAALSLERTFAFFRERLAGAAAPEPVAAEASDADAEE